MELTCNACANFEATFRCTLLLINVSSSSSVCTHKGYRPQGTLKSFLLSTMSFFVFRSHGFTLVGVLLVANTFCLKSCCKNMCMVVTCFSFPTPDFCATNFRRRWMNLGKVSVELTCHLPSRTVPTGRDRYTQSLWNWLHIVLPRRSSNCRLGSAFAL